MPDRKLPFFITEHLRYQLRPYQRSAVGRFIEHWEEKDQQTAYLFQMATGSGKTLIMAALMLYLYTKGYRYFLFFVNSTAILDKTRDNFLNEAASKFLFQFPIQHQGQRVQINAISNFDDGHPDDLNILFTTVQGLHAKLQIARENSVTLEDIRQQKLVLISDEAHHLNASTKSKKEAAISWEQSVDKVIAAHAENVLLEFTATIDWSNKAIQEKYADRLLFDYSLKQFRQEGYSKEVKLLQADLPPFERALQAIILSQYRKQLFEQQGLVVKPVVLFKSKTIKSSLQFYETFQNRLAQLTVDDLETIGQQGADTIIGQAMAYFSIFNTSLAHFLKTLRFDFGSHNCLIVNSQSDSEQQQLLLNRLEDSDNPYRAIFAVDKLNEGWDVLNLFDIVRLYDTKANQKKPSRTTLSEAQLIGRGARYFPFQLTDDQVRFQRKFDNDLEHPLRIGEELYYHAAQNLTYLRELGTALKDIGIQAIQNEQKRAYPTRRTTNKQWNPIPSTITVALKSGTTEVMAAFATHTAIDTKKSTRIIQLKEINRKIIFKAMQQLPSYRFDRLQLLFPELKSTSELLEQWQHINIEAHGDEIQLKQPNPQTQLSITRSALAKIMETLSSVENK
ncbi:MAG: DEAD/DEAH box helicase family protein [Bacteroidota bacterium]